MIFQKPRFSTFMRWAHQLHGRLMPVKPRNWHIGKVAKSSSSSHLLYATNLSVPRVPHADE
jgi:hypothetical protein